MEKNCWEYDYLDILSDILVNGEENLDRTGVGTISVFGPQYTVNLKDGFPAVTTKKLQWKSVVSELLWMLEGETDERRLAEIHYGKPREQLFDKKTIWTDNANNQGVKLGLENNNIVKELGKVYGKQYRDFGGVDQITRLVNGLQNDPKGRRHIVSAWNPPELNEAALPPCHSWYQMYVGKNGLSCKMYQRSNDAFLGGFFNVASYALLTHMVASYLDMPVDKFIHTMGDMHIYNNHIDQVKEQLSRPPLTHPILRIPKIESFDIDYIKTLDVNDFILENYEHHPAISAPMAI